MYSDTGNQTLMSVSTVIPKGKYALQATYASKAVRWTESCAAPTSPSAETGISPSSKCTPNRQNGAKSLVDDSVIS